MNAPTPLELVLGAASGALGQLVISCKQAQDPLRELGAGKAIVGCVRELSAQDLGAVTLAIRPGTTVRLVHANCAQCPASSGKIISDLRDNASHYARVLSTGVTVTSEEVPASGMSRRQALSAWLPTLQLGQDDQRVSRRAILEACDPPTAAPVNRPIATTGCTGCWACLSACPTSALSVTSNIEDADLNVTLDQCTACGLCVSSCPEDVLSLAAPQIAPRRRRAGAPAGSMEQRVTQYAKARCVQCHHVLSPGEVGTCSSCGSQSAILDDVLSRF